MPEHQMLKKIPIISPFFSYRTSCFYHNLIEFNIAFRKQLEAYLPLHDGRHQNCGYKTKVEEGSKENSWDLTKEKLRKKTRLVVLVGDATEKHYMLT